MTHTLAPVLPIRPPATPASALARAAYDHGQTAADLTAFLSSCADFGIPVFPEPATGALAELAALQASPLEVMTAAGVRAILEASGP